MIHARQIQARQAACAACPQKKDCRSRFKVCDEQTGCPSGAHATIDAEHAKTPAPARTLHCDDVRTGPGTMLKQLLKLVSIGSSEECQCDAMAEKMDRLGGQWCLDNIDEILDTMESEAKRRGWPFLRATADVAVQLAVSLT